MHDALVAGIITGQVWQGNQVKWTHQIMVRTPRPMVNIPKGHGYFITPSRGVQKTYRPTKSDPIRPDPPGWVGF